MNPPKSPGAQLRFWIFRQQVVDTAFTLSNPNKSGSNLNSRVPNPQGGTECTLTNLQSERAGKTHHASPLTILDS